MVKKMEQKENLVQSVENKEKENLVQDVETLEGEFFIMAILMSIFKFDIKEEETKNGL